MQHSQRDHQQPSETYLAYIVWLKIIKVESSKEGGALHRSIKSVAHGSPVGSVAVIDA
jgi:hypothetical protein